MSWTTTTTESVDEKEKEGSDIESGQDITETQTTDDVTDATQSESTQGGAPIGDGADRLLLEIHGIPPLGYNSFQGVSVVPGYSSH